MEKSANFCVKQKLYRTTADTYFDFLESVSFLKLHFHIFLFESWILNLQATIMEFLWKNPTEEIADFSIK